MNRPGSNVKPNWLITNHNQRGSFMGMNRIAELRDAKGWSQQDLADKLNTTAVSVGRYEKQDQRLTLPLLRRVAKEFDTTIGNIAGEAARIADHLPVPAYEMRAAAGAGGVPLSETPERYFMFQEQWLKRIAKKTELLAVVEVSGDSMWDTLHDGDHVLVDRSQINPRLEGLYVLRIDDVLVVKRIAMHPVSRLLTIKSDNAAYPTYENVNPDEIAVIGRVVWIGRSLG